MAVRISLGVRKFFCRIFIYWRQRKLSLISAASISNQTLGERSIEKLRKRFQFFVYNARQRSEFHDKNIFKKS